MNTPPRKAGYRLAVLTLLLTACVVVLGAFTRLVDAGLGCPDWPGCYGHILWPMDEQEVARANATFPDTPVEHDKTWPEQVHRLFASSLGLFCIALSAWYWRLRREDPDNYRGLSSLSLLLLGVVILQGMFGMWTVTLKLWPQVVTAHLLGGFTTLSLVWLLVLSTSGRRWALPPAATQQLLGLRRLVWVAFACVVLQIALGGWTTSNYAALACPDFPQCQSSWIPEMDFAQGFNLTQDIGPNYLGGLMDSSARTAIHFTHRVGALLVTAVLLLLYWRLGGIDPVVDRWRRVLLAVLILQIGLGITNILASLPLAVAVAHNAGGAVLLLTLVGLLQRSYTVTASGKSFPGQ